MDVLVYLAAEAGRVVSKEELLAAVWGGAFVEEGALSQAVHSLRKALGDSARQPRYIQTIPKRGYRLVARVTSSEPGSGGGPIAEALPFLEPAHPPEAPSPSGGRRRARLLLPAVIALAVIAATATGLWFAV
jgi:DNA-binding winged helix-turn-helix (wHTH) protein